MNQLTIVAGDGLLEPQDWLEARVNTRQVVQCCRLALAGRATERCSRTPRLSTRDGMPSGWAQSNGHKMVSPDDLKYSVFAAGR